MADTMMPRARGAVAFERRQGNAEEFVGLGRAFKPGADERGRAGEKRLPHLDE